MDKFLEQKSCDRCGKPLNGTRTMSMFNTDCICMKCKSEERTMPRYKEAQDADITEIKKGNYNFPGIGL